MARETTTRRSHGAAVPGLREALASALEEGADLPALFRAVQDGLTKALGLEAGVLWIRDADRRRFVGPSDLGLDPSGSLSFRDELPLRAQALAEPVWTADRKASGETPLSSLFDARARAFLIIPVLEEGRLLGIGAFASSHAGPESGMVERARDAASLLTAPLRRAIVQLGLQEDFKLHQQLLDLVRQMAGDQTITSFLQRAFHIVEKLMPVDAMFVATRREDGAYDALLETDLDDRDHRIFFPVPRILEPDKSSVILTIDQHRYVLILRRPEELVAPEGPTAVHMVGNTGRRSASLIYVPVWCGDELGGVLSVQSYRLNAYRHADAERLVLLSEYLALAIQTSRQQGGKKGRRGSAF